MAFQTPRSGAIAQINMTPMIDLLLVMLIIFLVIAPVHPKGLQAAIPQPALSSVPVRPEPDVVLAIAGDGSVQVNTRDIRREDLGAVLTVAFRTRVDHTIFLKGARELLFGQVAEVIDLAKAAGADRVALISERAN